MSWIVYDSRDNNFYHFDTKASANRFYAELVKTMKSDEYSDGDSIFVSQIKDCSVKREGKIKQQRYF